MKEFVKGSLKGLEMVFKKVILLNLKITCFDLNSLEIVLLSLKN